MNDDYEDLWGSDDHVMRNLLIEQFERQITMSKMAVEALVENRKLKAEVADLRKKYDALLSDSIKTSNANNAGFIKALIDGDIRIIEK